jgi:hypothetical protein
MTTGARTVFRVGEWFATRAGFVPRLIGRARA